MRSDILLSKAELEGLTAAQQHNIHSYLGILWVVLKPAW